MTTLAGPPRLTRGEAQNQPAVEPRVEAPAPRGSVPRGWRHSSAEVAPVVDGGLDG